MIILGFLSQFSWLHLDCFKVGITLSSKKTTTTATESDWLSFRPKKLSYKLTEKGLSCEEGGVAADVI